MKSIPFTKEGFAKMKQEFDDLKASRPDALMHLKRARELGDLSENGYYKASRAKLSFIDGRLRHLKHLIDNAHIIQASNSDTVEIGKVVVIDDGGGEKTYEIVGGYESNPLEGRISHISPLGKAIIGAKVGERRTFESPAGKREYTIRRIKN